ncbi:hypothetical protein D5045_14105 [Verminephrobacter eiseniae]|uniref:hypothetical protein n=1 Tax=Verminephrobacter eiseniae TaxID=364317 RepID=UPI002238F14A|nr:hypothetical protein [Verminephrobacter eiseniae]MCW5261269.1 hypothetical protein [Verminephrobacter eiseniae]
MSPAENPVAALPLYLFVGSGRVEYGVVQRSGADRAWWPQASVGLPMAARQWPSLAALQQALEALPAGASTEHARRPPRMIRVLLADAWLAAVRLAWSQALTRPETAQRYARSQCLAAGLELLAQDVIRIDDAPFEACRLAIVYPQALLSILGQWAQRMGGQLASVQPLSVAAWMLLRRNGRNDPQGRKPKPGSAAQAVVVLDGASITIAHSLARSRWGSAWMDGLSQRHAPGGHSSASTVAQAWQRLCLREPGLSAVGAVAVLDFSDADPQPAGPGVWAPPFVRLERQGAWIETAAAAHALSLQWRPAPWRPASWRMWQWVVVAALGVVFSALVAQLTREVSSVATLRAKTAAMERARQPVTAKKTWSRQEVAHVQAVNRAIRELNLPIDALMNALVAPKDIRVAVLGMETLGKATHAPSQTAGIKILAQACSGADMARYVVFVSGRKPFSGAHLVRHEILDKGQNCPYRFTVEARWSA